MFSVYAGRGSFGFGVRFDLPSAARARACSASPCGALTVVWRGPHRGLALAWGRVVEAKHEGRKARPNKVPYKPGPLVAPMCNAALAAAGWSVQRLRVARAVMALFISAARVPKHPVSAATLPKPCLSPALAPPPQARGTTRKAPPWPP